MTEKYITTNIGMTEVSTAVLHYLLFLYLLTSQLNSVLFVI